MTSKRVCRVFLVIAGAAFAQSLPPTDGPAMCRSARAEDAATDTARAAMEKAFLAVQKDHASVHADGFEDRLGGVVTALRAEIAKVRAAEKDAANAAALPQSALDAIALAAASVADAPLSDPSLRVVVPLLFPAERVKWPGDSDAEVRDALVAAVRAVFAAPNAADCWDTQFGGLAEVVAWRKAHDVAPTGPEPPPPPPPAPRGDGPVPPVAPPGPPPLVPPGPVPPGPTPPDPAPVPPASTEPALPPPDAADPLVNLVSVDRARTWVGPWTGWIQDVPEKENHRQRRPAKAVWIDRYEVTCAAYLAFLQALPAAKRRAMLPVAWSVDEAVNPAHPEGRASWPVTGVTYLQAVAYAESLGKRLPTEDEWDRAAGGGEKDPRAFPWGAGAAGRRWTFGGSGADSPEAVDGAPSDRTPEGVIGLAGNVAEMVATIPDRHDAPSKVQPTQQIVVRGGSWKTSRESDCGTTFRWVIEAGQGAPHVGFRCVMDDADYRKRSAK